MPKKNSAFASDQCEVLRQTDITHHGQDFTQYVLRAKPNKGLYAESCTIKNLESKDNVFLLIDKKAMYTFRMKDVYSK